MKAKLKSTRGILTDIAEKLTFVLHIEKQAEFWQKIWKEKMEKDVSERIVGEKFTES